MAVLETDYGKHGYFNVGDMAIIGRAADIHLPPSEAVSEEEHYTVQEAAGYLATRALAPDSDN